MRNTWRFLIFLISAEVMAQGTIVPDLPRDHPRLSQPLQVRHLGVEVSLDGVHALTQVEQIFFNPGSRMEEGSYLFPLPAGAHIESFSMFINGVETPAELLDAKKAATIYGEIVRKMKDPALLEYMGGSLFKAKVFPIEARSEKRIKLSYRQLVEVDDNLHRYTYPLRASRFAAEYIESFVFQASVSTNQPLKTLYSPTHQLAITRDGASKANLSLEAENYMPDRDITLLYSSGASALGMQALAHVSGGEGFFWLSITPDLNTQRVSDKDLILVIDTSGSMAGEKMEKARSALRFCVENLNQGDRFEMIRFSTEAESFSGNLLPASKANRQKALKFIEELQPIGGTNLEDALRKALALPCDSNRPTLIALITDGKPTIGMRDETRLIEMAAQSHTTQRIFTFGIGQEINVHLLDKLSGRLGGWRTYAEPNEEIELKLSSFYRKIQSPVLTNLRLTISGVKTRALHPNKLPDLFLGLPLNVFGRFERSGPANIVLEGDLNGKKMRYEHRFVFPKKDTNHPFVPELWAQRRVGFLLDEIRLQGEDKELVEEVTGLAKKYGIVTPYTSYLILEDSAIEETTTVIRPKREERDALEKAYRGMKQKSGYAGVSASESIQEMATADSLAPAPIIEGEIKKAPRSKVNVQQAGGRAFYLSENFWQDALLEGSKSLPEHEVAFASKAWFQLLEDHPQLKQILALGSHVRFVFDGHIYVVSP